MLTGAYSIESHPLSCVSPASMARLAGSYFPIMLIQDVEPTCDDCRSNQCVSDMWCHATNYANRLHLETRFFKSAREMAKELRTYRCFPASHEILSHDDCEGYSSIPIIYENLKGEQFIVKNDVFVFLQNIVATKFDFMKTPLNSAILGLYLKTCERGLMRTFELIPWSERVLESIKRKFGVLTRQNEKKYPPRCTFANFEEVLKKYKQLNPVVASRRRFLTIENLLHETWETVAEEDYHRLCFVLESVGTVINQWKFNIPHQPTAAFRAVRVFVDGEHRFVMADELEGTDLEERGRQNIWKTIDWKKAKEYANQSQIPIEFIRTPIMRTKHRAVPIRTPNGEFCLLAVDVLFEVFREMLFGLKVFQRARGPRWHMVEAFVETLAKYFPAHQTAPFFMSQDQILLVSAITIGSFHQLCEIPAKGLEEVYNNGEYGSLGQVIQCLGLDKTLFGILHFVAPVSIDALRNDRHSGIDDFREMVDNCARTAFFETFPRFAHFVYTQNAGHRLLNHIFDHPSMEFTWTKPQLATLLERIRRSIDDLFDGPEDVANKEMLTKVLEAVGEAHLEPYGPNRVWKVLDEVCEELVSMCLARDRRTQAARCMKIVLAMAKTSTATVEDVEELGGVVERAEADGLLESRLEPCEEPIEWNPESELANRRIAMARRRHRTHVTPPMDALRPVSGHREFMRPRMMAVVEDWKSWVEASAEQMASRKVVTAVRRRKSTAGSELEVPGAQAPINGAGAREASKIEIPRNGARLPGRARRVVVYGSQFREVREPALASEPKSSQINGAGASEQEGSDHPPAVIEAGSEQQGSMLGGSSDHPPAPLESSEGLKVSEVVGTVPKLEIPRSDTPDHVSAPLEPSELESSSILGAAPGASESESSDHEKLLRELEESTKAVEALKSENATLREQQTQMKKVGKKLISDNKELRATLKGLKVTEEQQSGLNERLRQKAASREKELEEVRRKMKMLEKYRPQMIEDQKELVTVKDRMLVLQEAKTILIEEKRVQRLKFEAEQRKWADAMEALEADNVEKDRTIRELREQATHGRMSSEMRFVLAELKRMRDEVKGEDAMAKVTEMTKRLLCVSTRGYVKTWARIELMEYTKVHAKHVNAIEKDIAMIQADPLIDRSQLIAIPPLPDLAAALSLELDEAVRDRKTLEKECPICFMDVLAEQHPFSRCICHRVSHSACLNRWKLGHPKAFGCPECPMNLEY